MSSLHRKTSSSQRTVGASSGYDGYNEYNGNSSTQANTLANRRPSVDHNRVLASNGKKQRPITSYSTLIPPPSPTYFRLQEMGASKGAQNGARPDSVSYSQYLQQHQQPGELAHLKPLDSRAVQANGEPDAPATLHQRISIWMINEGTLR
ncbi:hypothetical protein EMPS_02582 [Entomortierella parvispora]|uniref:Uncharacterized protein n=1 Tax=Entomortierella parvispora TaxID=205924 RepID=A0A9P3H551_9FUNG|nr:hypothetical protein EMPS_02582 [Entomortierella parvispora]